MKRNDLVRDEGPAAERVAGLEAENAALRRALARAGLDAEQAAERHKGELSAAEAGRAADAASAGASAAEAEARHRREAAAGRIDLAAAEGANEALRRANAELAASRAALREREERLRLVLDSATDYAIFSTDLDRRVTSWNAGAERLLGWPEGEIVGRTADAIFTPEDRDAGEPAREAEGALRDGRAADERWHQRKDGTRFWANGLVLPLRDPDADPAAPPAGLLKIMRDETARRRAGEALREAEDHLRHTVELNPQIPWTADPEGRITGFSERWLEVTGLAREAATGEGWMQVPHPEDREGMAAAWARAVSTGEPYDAEARLRMADGSHRWWRARAAPRLDAEGRIVRWYGTTEDIHDRKEAEERLREGEARWRGLFESMQEGLEIDELVYGPDGRPTDFRYLDVNPAWERHTGIPRAAAVGRLLSEVVPGLDPVWVETYARVVETGEPAHVERFVPQLGRWYEVRAHRTAGTGRFGSLVMDVTGRKAAEARRDALVELGDRLRDLRDPGEIARAAAEVTGRALGASRAGYGAVGEEGTLRVERDWTGGSAAGAAGEWPSSDCWAGFADDLRRGEAVVIRDSARDPRTAARADAHAATGVLAQVVVPVVEAGRIAAILFVHGSAPRDWTEEEVAFVRGVAERAWAAAERARAEAALRESEGRLQATQDHAGVGIVEIDDRGRYARVNETYARLSGWTAADLAGQSYWDLIEDGGDREDARRDFGRLVRGEVGRLAAFREYTNKDGRRWWAEITATAIRGAPDASRPRGRFLYAVRVVQDVTERKRAEERRALLVNELNHRVKNTLAVVQSLAAQTARGAADLPAFAAAFRARLMALARAHDLLTREDWEGAALAEVARAALDRGAGGDWARVDLSACASDAVLSPDQSLALALALHELATNALKHGALSVPDGRVAVSCGTGPGDGAPFVEWTERGGPRVPGPPARRGFGLRLLAAQAGVAADLRFEPEGLRCTLRLPPAR